MMKGKSAAIWQISLAVVLVLGLGLAVAVPLGASSNVYYVATTGSDTTGDGSAGNPWATIGYALNQTVCGDTIKVAAGTYNENIALKGGVQVLGAGSDVTTIQGSGNSSVVTADGVGPSTRLDGFTITGGHAQDGGGMYNTNGASPTVSNCVFAGNSADYGGGIRNSDSSPTVTNCTFSGNTAWMGGAMNNINSSPVVTNCIFSGNSAEYGGGMYNTNNSSATVTNCVFSANTAFRGGGMFNYQDASPSITNNIIVSNNASDTGGGIYTSHTASAIIDYNDVWGNTPDNYYGCSAGANDISQDPLFVDAAAGDFHLQATSPCIDAGNSTAPSLPGTDFEGDPRVVDGNGDGVAVVDMGVDEYAQVEVWVNWEWAGSDPGDSVNGYTFGYSAFAAINDGVAAVASGGTVHVYPGTYDEPTTVITRSLTLISVSGDWRDTIIDNFTDPEILITDPAGPFSGVVTIYGFAISGGTEGIYIDGLDGGTVTISNCLVYDNGSGIVGAGTLDGDIFIDNCIIARNGDLRTGIRFDSVVGTVEITDSVIGAYYDVGTSDSYGGNTGNGIQIGEISPTGSVLIDNNKIVWNGRNGIFVGGTPATVYGQLTITDNVIGAYDYDLASVDGYFCGNSWYGVFIDHVAETGVVMIEGNKIAENQSGGICFGGPTTIHGDVTINDNIIGAWTQHDGENIRRYTGNGHTGIIVFTVGPAGTLTITGNRVAENSHDVVNLTGIYVAFDYGETTIENNDVGEWEETILGEPVAYYGNGGPGIMITSVPAGSLLVQDNNVIGNTNHGIYISNSGDTVGEVVIQGNTVDDNGTGGSGISLFQVSRAIVSGNTITRHIEDIGSFAGVWLSSSHNNTISQNTITDNWFGVWIGSDSSGNLVVNNNISRNEMHGMYIAGDSNKIVGNIISDNSGAATEPKCGIYLTSNAGGNVIKLNNITDNTVNGSYGVYNDNTGEYLNATNNWWGDVSGPTHAANPGGSGDAVNDYVLPYYPWLGAPLELPAVHYETLTSGLHEVDASEEADTRVTLTVTGEISETDIYIARYESQPFPDEPFPDEALGKWIDIYVSKPQNVSWPVYVQVFYTAGEVAAAGIDENSLGLYYYTSPQTFHRCSDTGVNTAQKFIWANVTAEEAGYLLGSPFGAGGSPRAFPPVGGTAYPVNTLALLAPWLVLAVVVAAGGFYLVRRRHNNST
jgi:parallel beta-helix repeat protein